MADLIIDLVILLAILVLAAVTLLGWGRLVERVVGLSATQQVETGTLWLGFVALLGAADLVHLAIRIDWMASLGCLLIGLAGCLTQGGVGWARLFRAIALQVRAHPIVAVAVAGLAIAWCLRGMGLPNNFDSGLYHFASIRWLNEQPLVPGIGNLHWRLALNQGYFGFAALLNLAPFWGKGYAAGGLLILLLCLATLLETCVGQGRLWRRLVGGLLVIYLGYLASGVANPAPDGIVSMMQVAMFLFLFRALAQAPQREGRPLPGAVVILSLCVGLAMVKLSGAAYALACGVLAMVTYRKEIAAGRDTLAKLFALLLLVAVIHLGRGYLLSGYPLFPASIAGMPALDWAVSPEVLRHESDLILTWARAPGSLDSAGVLAGWAWMRPWALGLPISVQMLFAGCMLLTAAALLCIVTGRADGAARRCGALYAPLLVAVAFWLGTAPDPRFLGAVPVLLAALGTWIVLSSPGFGAVAGWIANQSPRSPAMMALALLICLACLKLTGMRSAGFAGWIALPVSSVQTRITGSGLAVLVPVERGQCWNAPLPCASIFNANLASAAWTPLAIGSLRLFERPAFFVKSPPAAGTLPGTH